MYLPTFSTTRCSKADSFCQAKTCKSIFHRRKSVGLELLVITVLSGVNVLELGHYQLSASLILLSQKTDQVNSVTHRCVHWHLKGSTSH